MAALPDAKLLGEDQAETLRRQTLDEEKETDRSLLSLLSISMLKR